LLLITPVSIIYCLASHLFWAAASPAEGSGDAGAVAGDGGGGGFEGGVGVGGGAGEDQALGADGQTG